MIKSPISIIPRNVRLDRFGGPVQELSKSLESIQSWLQWLSLLMGDRSDLKFNEDFLKGVFEDFFVMA